MNPALLSICRLELDEVLDLRFLEGRDHLCRSLEQLDAFDRRREVFLVAAPPNESVERPKVDVDTRSLDLAAIHFLNDASLDRSPDLVGAFDGSKYRRKG